MMRTGWLRSRGRRGEYGQFVRLAAGAAIIIALGLFLGPYIRDLTVSLVYSSERSGEFALTPRSVLIERLLRAEDEIVETRYQAALVQPLAEKLAALEAEVGARERTAYRTARVVAAPPISHYDTLLIAAGSDDGVALGDSVSIFGVQLGTVTAVTQKTALAALNSSPGSTRDAYLGEPSAIVVMRGLGGGAFETSVPSGVKVAPGDVAQDARTREPYATVVSVVEREIDTAQTVRLALIATPASVRYVSLTHAETIDAE